MKKNYCVYKVPRLTFFIICLSLISINSFSQWTILNSNTTENLNAIEFSDANRGFAVGANAESIVTNNQGLSWQHIALPIGVYEKTYHDIELEGDTGYIFFQDILNPERQEMQYLRTIDEGQTWSEITIPNLIAYGLSRDAYFFNGNTGYVLLSPAEASAPPGGDRFNDNIHVIKTENAGGDWTEFLIENPFATERIYMNAITFLTQEIGIIAGERNLVRATTDGGEVWSVVTVDKAPDDMIYLTAVFPSAESLILAGKMNDKGLIVRSNDAGSTWDSMHVAEVVQSIEFLNAAEGYAVGNNGMILYTNDGGLNWITQNSGVSENLLAIDVYNDSAIYVSGANGVIITNHVIDTFIVAAFTGPATGCTGDTILFTNNSINANGYIWYVNGDSVSSDENLNYLFDTAGDYVVKLVVDSSDVLFDSTSNNITISTSPEALFTLLENTIPVSSDTITIGTTLESNNQTTGAMQYQWFFNNGLEFTTQNFSKIITESGELEVKLIASNGICKDTAIHILYVKDSTTAIEKNPFSSVNYKVYPNPFEKTINLSIELGFDQSDCLVKVMNVYGQIVFEQQFVNSTNSLIDLSVLPSGLYEVVLVTSDNFYIYPLVKK